MNYQILVGRKASIGESSIEVSSIKKIKLDMFNTKYEINGGPLYSEFDIKLAVSIAESEIEEENRPKGLLAFFTNKFGLFKRTFVLDPEQLGHTERCIFFQRAYGIRKYGYSNVGFFMHVRFGLKVHQIEFCWNNKKEYNKGVLPETLTDFKRVF